VCMTVSPREGIETNMSSLKDTDENTVKVNIETVQFCSPDCQVKKETEGNELQEDGKRSNFPIL